MQEITIDYDEKIKNVIKEIRTEGIDWNMEQPNEKKLTEILQSFADWIYREM